MFRHFDMPTRRYVGDHISRVPLANVWSQIKVKKNQPKPTDAEVVEIADSIREHGQKQPLLVRRHKTDAAYVVLQGEELLAALKLLRKRWVEVVIMVPSDRKVKEYEFRNIAGLYREPGAETTSDQGRARV